jgi:hypothetical protein
VYGFILLFSMLSIFFISILCTISISPSISNIISLSSLSGNLVYANIIYIPPPNFLHNISHFLLISTIFISYLFIIFILLIFLKPVYSLSAYVISIIYSSKYYFCFTPHLHMSCCIFFFLSSLGLSIVSFLYRVFPLFSYFLFLHIFHLIFLYYIHCTLICFISILCMAFLLFSFLIPYLIPSFLFLCHKINLYSMYDIYRFSSHNFGPYLSLSLSFSISILCELHFPSFLILYISLFSLPTFLVLIFLNSVSVLYNICAWQLHLSVSFGVYPSLFLSTTR